jgi:two-component system nitrogen regulation sensor histidine kinase NtrY
LRRVRTKLTPSASRAGGALFQRLFFIAALVAVLATFAAISGVSPNDPLQGHIGWLLGINTALIAILGWLIVKRYRDMAPARNGAGGQRLARRFMLLFGAAAIVPAAVVAIFLGATITRGLDGWFNERIDTIVEETADVAQARYDEFIEKLDSDIMLMATDLDNAAEGLRSGSALYPQYVRTQAALRQFTDAYVIDGQGRFLAMPEAASRARYFPPSRRDIEDARGGEIVQQLYRNSLVTGLVALDATEDAFLYVSKPIDREQLNQLSRAQAALTDYRTARDRSGRLQWLFALGYGQLAALVLMLSGRLGLEAARHVTGPIGRLAEAATVVRDGDLKVRVPMPKIRDEVHDLTRSFNTMTEQLGQQRDALILAREDAEDRRQFVETLLAEVSAGVIRTDEDLLVTLANRSAETLLGLSGLQGENLADVAPDFAAHAEAAISNDSAVDASIEVELNGSPRHIRLKAALDAAGGCVLTFDDATRLVNAQRQMAWRDVARRIAHEIRNPLTPIQLSTERLRKRYAGSIALEDRAVFDRCIDTILRQVSDIGRMVEEFSSFARMPKPSVAAFDMGHLLKEAIFAQGMVQPEISFDLKVARAEEIFVGDERLIGQAIGNLLKNAAEAIHRTPQPGDVSGRIEVSLDESLDGQLVITIEDNGPGFPEEARERLLEPYVTSREKGTGLGLAIVNRIIMDHGGAISLQNRSDGRPGALVRIVLPHTEHPDSPSADSPPETAQQFEEPVV